MPRKPKEPTRKRNTIKAGTVILDAWDDTESPATLHVPEENGFVHIERPRAALRALLAEAPKVADFAAQLVAVAPTWMALPSRALGAFLKQAAAVAQAAPALTDELETE